MKDFHPLNDWRRRMRNLIDVRLHNLLMKLKRLNKFKLPGGMLLQLHPKIKRRLQLPSPVSSPTFANKLKRRDTKLFWLQISYNSQLSYSVKNRNLRKMKNLLWYLIRPRLCLLVVWDRVQPEKLELQVLSLTDLIKAWSLSIQILNLAHFWKGNKLILQGGRCTREIHPRSVLIRIIKMFILL